MSVYERADSESSQSLRARRITSDELTHKPDDGAAAPGRSDIAGCGLDPLVVLQLQRQGGNQAVTHLIEPRRPEAGAAVAVVQRDDFDPEDNYPGEDDSTQSDWGMQYGFEPYEREVNWDQRAVSAAPAAHPGSVARHP